MVHWEHKHINHLPFRRCPPRWSTPRGILLRDTLSEVSQCKFASVTNFARGFHNHEAINQNSGDVAALRSVFHMRLRCRNWDNLEYNARNCIEPLRITRHRQYCNSVEWRCGQSVVRLLSQAGNPSSHFVLPPKKKFPVAGEWAGPPNNNQPKTGVRGGGE